MVWFFPPLYVENLIVGGTNRHGVCDITNTLESHPSLICKFDVEILYEEGVKVSSKSLIWIFKWGLWKAVILDWLEIKGNKI